MAEDAKNQRWAAKGRFTRKFTGLMDSINDYKGEEIVKRNYDELKEAWRKVETKHDPYTIFLEDREAQASKE